LRPVGRVPVVAKWLRKDDARTVAGYPVGYLTFPVAGNRYKKAEITEYASPSGPTNLQAGRFPTRFWPLRRRGHSWRCCGGPDSRLRWCRRSSSWLRIPARRSR